MQAAISFEENVGLVHLQAKNGFKWAAGAGTGLSYEDMFQEASEAFLIAAAGFNPDAGVKFSAYYTQVAFSQFRKAIGIETGVKNLNPTQREEIAARKAENKRRASAALPQLPDMHYGISPVSFTDLGSHDEEGAAPFEQSLASDAMTPEEAFEIKQAWAHVSASLSPLAQLVVEWLKNPPPALMEELRKQEAHADHRVELGMRSKAALRDGVSIASVSRFLQLVSGVSKTDLILVEDELMRAVKRIEEM